MSSFTKPCNVLSMFLNFEPWKLYVLMSFVLIKTKTYNTLLISLLIYLLSLTCSLSCFKARIRKIAIQVCGLLHFLNFRFQFSCKPQCAYQSRLLVVAGVLFVFLATRRPCTKVLLIYSEINIASNDNSNGLEANKALHALAFFQKFYV